jgi:transcriptional regulator with XRE-family HTH domain
MGRFAQKRVEKTRQANLLVGVSCVKGYNPTPVNEDTFFRGLGQRIRRLRQRAGYSQEAMMGFGFSARHWQQIEAGRPITVSTLFRICQVFQCPMDRLVRGLGHGAAHSHEVLFCGHDVALLRGLTVFVATALNARNSAIVVATKVHRTSLLKRLRGQGVDIDEAIQRGAFISLDAEQMLSKVMVNKVPDRELFVEKLRDLINSAANAAKTEHSRVAIFGECVGLLYTQDNLEAALELERAGNDLLDESGIPLDILCAYPALHKKDPAFKSICAEHSAVLSG